MYIETDEGRDCMPRAYWLIKPTDDEIRAHQQLSTWRRLSSALGVCFIVITLSVLIAPAVISKVTKTNTPPTIVALSLLGLMFVSILCAVVCGIKENGWLRRMGREKRAVQLSPYGVLRQDDLGYVLMSKILFGGERSMSVEHMMSVLRQHKQDRRLDSFLRSSRNWQALQYCAAAQTEVEVQEWRKLLEPQLADLFADLQPLIEKCQASEAEDRRLTQLERHAAEERGCSKVRAFAAEAIC